MQYGSYNNVNYFFLNKGLFFYIKGSMIEPLKSMQPCIHVISIA